MMNAPYDIGYFASWLANGERGDSSEAIVANLTGHVVGGLPPGNSSYPRDKGDFKRCLKLLRQYPDIKYNFRRVMRDVSPVWAGLIERWEAITYLVDSGATYDVVYKAICEAIEWGTRPQPPRNGRLFTATVDGTPGCLLRSRIDGLGWGGVNLDGVTTFIGTDDRARARIADWEYVYPAPAKK